MKAVFLAAVFFMIFQGKANATDGIPTTITNSDKFQLQGALVVTNKNPDGAIQVRQAVVPLNIQAKTLPACQASAAAACNATLLGNGLTSKITTSWLTDGYCVVLGECVAK